MPENLAPRLHHNVHYAFIDNGVHKGKGHAVVLAESVEAAELAFRAEYPDGPRFEYRVFKVVANPISF